MHTSPTTKAGFTIVEMVTATAVLSVVLALGLGGAAASVDSTAQLTHVDDLRRRCFATIDRLANHLSAAEKGVVGITAGVQEGTAADVLSFAENVGFDTELELIEFGPLRQVRREGSALLLEIDTSGDGLIGPDDQTLTLAGDVFAFQVSPAEIPLAADHVDIELTLERQIGVHSDGTPWRVSVTSHRRVFLRDSQ